MNEKYNTVLFKYMPLTPQEPNGDLNKINKDRNRIKQIFLDHKVYFSKPSQLNDVFEFKPRFMPPKTKNKRRELAKYETKKPYPHASRAERQKIEALFYQKGPQNETERISK